MKKTLLALLLGVSILTIGGCGKQETKGTVTEEVVENVEEVPEVDETAAGEVVEEETEETAGEVEEETLGVPAGQVPDYAKDWTEADYGDFEDDTAVVEPVKGEWSSGVFTINGETYSIGDPFSKFEDNGWVIECPEDELYVGEDIADAFFTKGDVQVYVYGDTTTAGDYKTATLTTFETDDDNIALGTEVCGIVIGDDFGKYMDALGTPCLKQIYDGHQVYFYKSSDFRLKLRVVVDDYNISGVQLYVIDENED